MADRPDDAEPAFGRAEGEQPSLSPFQAGLRMVCPRCGEGRLLKGLLTVRPGCEDCHLDFSEVDPGDGPAVFIILIVGFIVVFGAMYVELSFAPPVWVHVLLWVPITLGGSIALLRPLKALMIALQYHHTAREGRRDDGAD